MSFQLWGLALLAHACFWGLGTAMLLTPRRHKRLWPLLVLPFGLATQSAVVWLGAHLPVEGTQVYARWSLLLPAAALVVALRRSGGLASLSRDLVRFRWLGLAVVLCGAFLLLPYGLASKSLTTSSLGSCDAADYASGARVFMEFSPGDRMGLLGQTEVVSIASIDNFHDLWLRLNHFVPTSLIAFNASVFGLHVEQVINLLGVLFLLASIPCSYLFARSVLRLPPAFAGASSLLLGLSPLMWYGVYHVALGQLCGALGLGVLSWATLALWRTAPSWRFAWNYSGALLLAGWLVLGSYNIVVLFGGIPVGLFVLGSAVARSDWRRFWRWLGFVSLHFAVLDLLCWSRLQGIYDRLWVNRVYHLGWKVPLLSADGWFGVVQGPGLESYVGWPRLALVAALAAALLVGWLAWRRREASKAWLALAFLAPAVGGYVFLLEMSSGYPNVGYEAYKWIGTFYPCVVAALCGACLPLARRPGASRLALGLLAVVVVAGTLTADVRFARAMSRPPLTVGPELLRLRQVEARKDIESINMLVGDFWSRLWASAFLLRKRQYFALFTYEGHRNTALLGDWSLVDFGVPIKMPSRDCVPVGHTSMVVRVRSPHFFRVGFAAGWYGEESLPNGARYWRWARKDAVLEIENPHAHPLHVVVHMYARSLVPRHLVFRSGGRIYGTAKVGVETAPVQSEPITIPPGLSQLEISTDKPAIVPGPGDTRTLGFAAYDMEIEDVDDEPGAAPSGRS